MNFKNEMWGEHIPAKDSRFKIEIADYIMFLLAVIVIFAFWWSVKTPMLKNIAGSININGVESVVYHREDGQYVVSVGTELCKQLPWDNKKERCDRRNENLIFDRKFTNNVDFK